MKSRLAGGVGVTAIAAVLTLVAPTAADAAVSQLGPGCSTTSVCLIRTDGTPIGYDGTGTLNLTQSNIRTVMAGTRATTFKLSSGTVVSVQATKSVTWPNSGQTITTIAR